MKAPVSQGAEVRLMWRRRKAMVGVLREKFAHLGLTYSIGGQISFDVFPKVGGPAAARIGTGAAWRRRGWRAHAVCRRCWPAQARAQASLARGQGWDKTYCLQFVEKEHSEIHFFGDKTFEVGAPSSHAQSELF